MSEVTEAVVPTSAPSGRGGAVLSAIATLAKLAGHAWGRGERLWAEAVRDARRVSREAEAFFDTASFQAGRTRLTLRAAPRLARIGRDLLGLVARYRLLDARLQLLAPEQRAAKLAALHEAGAQRVYKMCVDLRGAILKVGQFVSTRLDLLPPAYAQALAKLQDQVPPVPFEAIAARVEAELGAPLEQLFASFDREPLATASLAQVHAAELLDGTPVVVKVQLPEIEETVALDLVALHASARVLGENAMGLDLTTFADELARSVWSELDYEAEATHAEAFHAAFAGHPDVVVPRVVRERSSHRVLTLERLHGERLLSALDATLERGEAGLADREHILFTLVSATARQVLEHGRFHADPHPGNFLVLPGPKVGLLDFGAVKVLTPEQRTAYREVLGAILRGDTTEVVRLLQALGFRSRGGDDAVLAQYADLLLESIRVEPSQIDPRQILDRTLALARDNPAIQVPQDFVLLGRVLAALGGLIMHYKPRLQGLLAALWVPAPN